MCYFVSFKSLTLLFLKLVIESQLLFHVHVLRWFIATNHVSMSINSICLLWRYHYFDSAEYTLWLFWRWPLLLLSYIRLMANGLCLNIVFLTTIWLELGQNIFWGNISLNSVEWGSLCESRSNILDRGWIWLPGRSYLGLPCQSVLSQIAQIISLRTLTSSWWHDKFSIQSCHIETKIRKYRLSRSCLKHVSIKVRGFSNYLLVVIE